MTPGAPSCDARLRMRSFMAATLFLCASLYASVISSAHF